MEIYEVKQGDTIQGIAEKYGVSVDKILQDNGLLSANDLVNGQSVVIAYPKQSYIVKEGDTLFDIARLYNVSIVQLLANNPFLAERQFIYPGDHLVISYETKKKITTHGNSPPNINKLILRKTLPFLTYLSVLNFTATTEGGIKSYYDDTEIIRIAKEYGVAPLMLLTTLTITGDANIRVAFDLLLNEEYQNNQIENILKILKERGYYGLNLSLQYMSISNLKYYESYFKKVVERLNSEGYPVFLTVVPELPTNQNNVDFEKIDYSILDQLAYNIIFMSYEWATKITPPSPISSYNVNSAFLNYILQYIPPEKIILGIATIGYDWELPFVPGLSNVNSISLKNVYNLARDVGGDIKYDEVSQSPYFSYSINKVQHIVWFINSKSINTSLELVSQYNLSGISIWNITIFNPELWLIINAQYEIEKVEGI